MADSYVYVIAPGLADGLQSVCKVGVTKDPKGRLASLQTGHPHELEIVHLFRLPKRSTATSVEAAILALRKSVRMQGEWLAIDPAIAVQVGGLCIAVALHAAGHTQEEIETIGRACGAWSIEEGKGLVPNRGVLP